MSPKQALLLLALLLFGASVASAQPWQIKTPRQVLPVPSDGSTVNFPNVNLIVGMRYRIHASGSVNVSSGDDMADACYYIFNSFLLFAPSITPVSMMTRNGAASEDWFYNFWKASGFQGGNYQSSHIYDASIGSLGSPLSFRFFDTKEPSVGPQYYSDNVGSILIDVARETPGVVVQKDTLNFGIVSVGSFKILLDSICGYGIDGYSVDRVSLTGPASGKFAVRSERTVPFGLIDTTNEFQFTYTPTGNALDTAEFHIFSKSAFGADTEKIVYLFGQGNTSQLGFSIDTLDFGTIKTGTTKMLPDQIQNLSNSSVNVTSIVPETAGSPYSATGVPVTIQANASSPISVTFAPTVSGNYFEKFDVTTGDGSVFHFYAKGIGGLPKVSLEKNVLDFGEVMLKQSRTLTDQFGNIGSAPMNIVSTQNTNPLEYIITGNQGPVSYEPGHSIIYSITFSPQVHIPYCGNHDGAFIFNFDDGTSTTITFKGCDHQPLSAILQIDTFYFCSAGNQVNVLQHLVNPGDPLDSTLNPVTHLTERISFDPMLFDLLTVSKGPLINTSDWILTATPSSGAVDITLSSSTSHLGPGGVLLALRFQAHTTDLVGQFTTLVQNNISFSDPFEPLASSVPGKITISDICFPVNIVSGIPGTSIEQNNPNPFNPTTHLHYAIGKNTDGSAVNVRITLYDQLGRFAGELLNAQRTPGMYDYEFDGSAYASGAYIYVFQAGDHTEAKTMLLVK